MEFVYEQSTRKAAGRSDEVLPPEFSREHLTQLLIYLEGELEAREHALEHLKEERTKLLLFQAKYAKICPTDPYHALSRDSQMVPDSKDEASLEEIYGDQLSKLETLIRVYREQDRKSRTAVVWTQNQMGKVLRELSTVRKEGEGMVREEVVRGLEEDKRRIQAEAEDMLKQLLEAKAKLEEMDKKLRDEKDAKQKVVVFLMNERKEMLATMAEMQLRKKTKEPSVSAESTLMIEELRREMQSLRAERDSLRNANKALKGEVMTLKETVRSNEEDLQTMKRNLMGVQKAELEERSLVVANRVAMSSVPSSSSSRTLPSSSSFPSTDRSRLPRAPSSPARPSVTLPKAPTTTTSTTVAKKTPAMGLSTMRRVTTSTPRTTVLPPAVPGPTDELDAALNTLNHYTTAPSAASLGRSSSLTRGKTDALPRAASVGAEPQATGTRPVSAASAYASKPATVGANVAPPGTPTSSRLPSKTDAKTAVSRTKSSLLRAFGKQ